VAVTIDPVYDDDPAAACMHGIGDHKPAGNLLCRVDSRSTWVTMSIRTDCRSSEMMTPAEARWVVVSIPTR
jgi:hypothetical protein